MHQRVHVVALVDHLTGSLEERVVDEQDLDVGVVGYEGELFDGQPKVEVVHHEAGLRDCEPQFKVACRVQRKHTNSVTDFKA